MIDVRPSALIAKSLSLRTFMPSALEVGSAMHSRMQLPAYESNSLLPDADDFETLLPTARTWTLWGLPSPVQRSRLWRPSARKNFHPGPP